MNNQTRSIEIEIALFAEQLTVDDLDSVASVVDALRLAVLSRFEGIISPTVDEYVNMACAQLGAARASFMLGAMRLRQENSERRRG